MRKLGGTVTHISCVVCIYMQIIREMCVIAISQAPASGVDWETRPGWVFIGIIAAIVLSGVLNQALPQLLQYALGNISEGIQSGESLGDEWFYMAEFLVPALAYPCASAWYCFCGYPSVFDGRYGFHSYLQSYHLSNSGECCLVSFLNGFLGSFIWGPLFCTCLTKGKLGVSHIVLGVIECIVIALYLYSFVYSLGAAGLV